MHVVALIGSLRQGSFNRMTYNAVRELLPSGVTMEEAAIRDLPLYDDDVRERDGYPEPAARLRAQIAAADAVLFISPEYNYSVPGALKNAIDWASRAPDPPLKGKPAAIMGASTGMIGTARMQYHLRQILVYVEALPTGRPEVMITFAARKFDELGRLADETTRSVISLHLETLVAWTRRLGGG